MIQCDEKTRGVVDHYVWGVKGKGKSLLFTWEGPGELISSFRVP